MRKYYPIWRQLKNTGYCELIVHPALFRRVIKAVQKEKYQDIAYSFELSENGMEARLAVAADSNTKTIKFTLTTRKLWSHLLWRMHYLMM